MAAKLDLNLPERASESVAERLVHTLSSLPFAIYTLVDLPETEFEALIKCCNSDEALDDDQKPVQRPPNWNAFIGKPLRVVFDFHGSPGDHQKDFDDHFFLAVTTPDWRDRGIMLVIIHTIKEDGKVCSFQCKASTTSVGLINLQVGNTLVDELRDMVEVSPDRNDD